MLIGVALIVPGVSGGTIAISMGIYDQIIDVITLGKATLKKAWALLPYAVGGLIGVAVLSYFLEKLLKAYPLETTACFVGMILGALPMLIKKVREQPFRLSHAIVLFSISALMILLPILGKHAGSGGSVQLEAAFKNAPLLLLIGVVAAATLIVPGVSGSMILMLLGYYEPLLSYVNTFVSALLHLDFAAMGSTLIILVPFGIGMLGGVIILARIVKALFRRFPYGSYYAIIGLVIASPFGVLYQQSYDSAGILTIFVCAALAAGGFLMATVLGKGDT